MTRVITEIQIDSKDYFQISKGIKVAKVPKKIGDVILEDGQGDDYIENQFVDSRPVLHIIYPSSHIQSMIQSGFPVERWVVNSTPVTATIEVRITSDPASHLLNGLDGIPDMSGNYWIPFLNRNGEDALGVVVTMTNGSGNITLEKTDFPQGTTEVRLDEVHLDLIQLAHPYRVLVL